MELVSVVIPAWLRMEMTLLPTMTGREWPWGADQRYWSAAGLKDSGVGAVWAASWGWVGRSSGWGRDAVRAQMRARAQVVVRRMCIVFLSLPSCEVAVGGSLTGRGGAGERNDIWGGGSG